MVDVGSFLRDGFLKLERPQLRQEADAARESLWESIAPTTADPSTWTEPVVWTADLYGGGPFGPLASSPDLAEAFDQICGKDGWVPRHCLGNIPVRFPVRPAAQDRGWHIDANTQLSDGSWTVTGRPQTMLLLTLLSEIGPRDAPTRIRVGSHRDVAAAFSEEPDPEASDMWQMIDTASAARPVAFATGSPADVYLVHPLCVHAADEHRGATPRFMSQAPVQLTRPFSSYANL